MTTTLNWFKQVRPSKLLRNELVWRLTIIFGVLFLSLALPTQLSANELLLIPTLLVAIVGLQFLLKLPQWGLLLAILSIIAPVFGPSGLSPTMVVVALLFALLILEMVLKEQRIQLVDSPAVRPLLIFVLVSTISLGFGQIRWYIFGEQASLGSQLGGWGIVVASAATFLLVAQRVTDVKWLERMIWLLLILMALFLVGFYFRPVRTFTRPLFIFVRAGSLFWTWAIILAFSQGYFNRNLRPLPRIALLCFAMFTLYTAYTVNGDWKSGWVPSVIGIATMLGLRYLPFAILASPLAVIPVANIVAGLIATDQYSWGTRVDAWLIVIEITKVNPILGLGFANYNAYAPLFPIRGYAVNFNSHSQYIDLYSQTGLLGLICFFWFFIVVWQIGWRLQARVPHGFEYAYVYGALGGLAATLAAAALGDWVLPFFFNIGLNGFRASFLSWVFLGGLVAIAQIHKQSDDANTKPLPDHLVEKHAFASST